LRNKATKLFVFIDAAKGTGVGSAGDTGNLVEISCLLQKRSQ